MKKNITTAVLTALFSLSAAAQNTTLINVPSDPVSAALGGATAVLQATPYVVSNNPAMMSLDGANAKFGASYGSWSPSTVQFKTIGVAGYGKIGKFAVGADFKMFNENEYTRLSSDGTVLGTYKPSDMNVALGLSYAFGESFSIGVTGKFLNSKISETTTRNAFGIDVMGLCKVKGFSFALGATNLATDIAAAKLGISYNIQGFTALADAQYIFKNSIMASVGAQYSLLDIVDFRAGWHFGSGAYAVPSYFSAGIGVGYKFIKLNGTYLFGNETLKNTFLAGLAFAF